MCLDGECNDYEIGKRLDQDLIEPDFFIVGHALFSWTYDARLLLNFVGLYSGVTYPNGTRSVSSILQRSIFTLKENKLIIQHKINEFEDAEESTPYKVVCELTR